MVELIHRLDLPAETKEKTPERKFEERARAIDHALSRTDLGEETYDWNIMKTNLAEVYGALNSEAQKKYFRQYTGLLEEIKTWEELESRGILN